MADAYDKFKKALAGFHPEGGVLAAFSGGADSVCLLHMLFCAKRDGLFPYPLAAAHLNHMLRGGEADRDEAFCAAWCREREIPFFGRRTDVNALAALQKCGTEETARNARYAFFEELLQENSAYKYVMTAHNRNDFCETMLFNLARGTGLCGLCSIPAVRGNILRPMLNIDRAEILAYNEANGLTFVTDSTNADVRYSRNRIRHTVLPALEEAAAGCTANMARSANLLKNDADYIDGEAKRVYDSLVSHGILYTENAHNIHTALLSRVLGMLYNHSGFSELENVHLEKLCDLVHTQKDSFCLSLPASFAVCSRGQLRFTSALPAAADFSLAVTLDTPMALPLGTEILVTGREKPTEDGWQCVKISAPSGNAPLTLRSRAAGDKITVFGVTHKVKRLIADAKLSDADKNRLFFLCAGEEILLIGGLAVSDSAFYRTGEALYIFYKKKETPTA